MNERRNRPDRRVAQRRVRPSLRRRMQSYWLVALVIGVLAGFGVYRLAAWPGFHLAQLQVAGTRVVSERDVVARAALDRNANLWLQDMGSASARIEAIPYVKTAHIFRSFPAGATVVVEERVPSACVTFADRVRETIDDARRILARGCPRGLRLHFILARTKHGRVGEFVADSELARLQRDAATLAGTSLRFERFESDRLGGLVGVMPRAVAVRFGNDADLEEKARLVEPILAATRARLPRVRTVDLRAPGTPVVEFR